jgi:protein-S-isoprenylcysteine O-methyltransferase Ste14
MEIPVYVLSVLLLIPVEEEGLQRAYGERYAVYQRTVKRLLPPLY